jgi:hypothetical protein
MTVPKGFFRSLFRSRAEGRDVGKRREMRRSAVEKRAPKETTR